MKLVKDTDDKNLDIKKVSDKEAEEAIRTILSWMGEDPKREGLLETPKRVVKAFKEYFQGYSEDPKKVSLVLEKAQQNKNNSKSLHYYTSFINKNFDDKKKILLIEALWEIVLSDGEIHDFEANLIRRLAGLLYISDVNSGNARKRALDKNSK